jgi:hypothetical protein
MRMARLRASIMLIGLVAFLLVADAPAPAQVVEKNDEILMTPLRVFKRIEKAWQAGNARSIADLASDSRVFVEIRGTDKRGGHFTKPQIFYIFKNMFASTNQATFTFVKYYNLEKPEGRVYGVATRSYKKDRSGRLYKDKVFVTLAKEGSRWAVAEIKSTW